MPLTRHFYALDEVEAALSYSATRNDVRETAFWCHELIQSECASEAISCLFQTWMWDKGPFALGWLLDAGKTLSSEEVTETDVYQAADRLRSCYALHDHSLWNILYLYYAGGDHGRPCDPVTPRTPPTAEPSAFSPADMFFLRACHQGKAASAWWISARRDAGEFWSLVGKCLPHLLPAEQVADTTVCLALFRRYETLLGYRSDAADDVLRCLAVLVLCLSPAQRAASLQRGRTKEMDAAAAALIADLAPQIGRRAARRYAIPAVCLYGITMRGRLRWTDSTLGHLHDVEPHLRGCTYWDGVLAERRLADEDVPDDVPDEWTTDEKKKSHGDGVMGPRDRLMAAKYVRLHLSRISRLAWNTGPRVMKLLDAAECLLSAGMRSTLDLVESLRCPTAPVAMSLRPVRRVIVF